MEKLNSEEMNLISGGKSKGNPGDKTSPIFFMAGFEFVVMLFDWLGNIPAVK
jgi:hypothetical protein